MAFQFFQQSSPYGRQTNRQPGAGGLAPDFRFGSPGDPARASAYLMSGAPRMMAQRAGDGLSSVLARMQQQAPQGRGAAVDQRAPMPGAKFGGITTGGGLFGRTTVAPPGNPSAAAPVMPMAQNQIPAAREADARYAGPQANVPIRNTRTAASESAAPLPIPGQSFPTDNPLPASLGGIGFTPYNFANAQAHMAQENIAPTGKPTANGYWNPRFVPLFGTGQGWRAPGMDAQGQWLYPAEWGGSGVASMDQLQQAPWIDLGQGLNYDQGQKAIAALGLDKDLFRPVAQGNTGFFSTGAPGPGQARGPWINPSTGTPAEFGALSDPAQSWRYVPRETTPGNVAGNAGAAAGASPTGTGGGGINDVAAAFANQLRAANPALFGDTSASRIGRANELSAEDTQLQDLMKQFEDWIAAG